MRSGPRSGVTLGSGSGSRLCLVSQILGVIVLCEPRSVWAILVPAGGVGVRVCGVMRLWQEGDRMEIHGGGVMSVAPDVNEARFA